MSGALTPVLVMVVIGVGILAGGFAWWYRRRDSRSRSDHTYNAESEQRRLAHALVKTAAVLNSTLDVDTVLERILEYAGSVVPHEAASIMLINDDTRTAHIVAHRSHPRLDLDDWAKTFVIPIDDPGYYVYTAIHENRAHVISDLTHDPHRLRVSETHWLLSFACAPLRRDGNVIGILNIYSATPGHFKQEYADWLQAFADQASIALQNAELNQTLEARAAELAGTVDELDAFAHTVAHDLRNPLTVVNSYSILLNEDFETLTADERSQCVTQILNYTKKMDNIISELLVLASVHGMDEVPLRPLDMMIVVHEALSHLFPLQEEHQATITQPERWPASIGHAPWIEEVWKSYISNAIKYGGDPPLIELGATPQANGTVRFWVRDNGQGLTAEQQSQLFAEFTQLHGVHARGYGLGLSVVRRMVERLGGSVGVESAVGASSTFYFTLPGA
jgi:signal transduction histidine kinase